MRGETRILSRFVGVNKFIDSVNLRNTIADRFRQTVTVDGASRKECERLKQLLLPRSISSQFALHLQQLAVAASPH